MSGPVADRAHPASQDRAGGPSDPSPSVSAKGAHPLRAAALEALAAAASPRPWCEVKGSPFCDLRAEATGRGEKIEGPLVTFHQHGGSSAAFEEQRANRALVAELVNNLPVIMAVLRDRDASLAEDALARLSPVGVAARPEGHRPADLSQLSMFMEAAE